MVNAILSIRNIVFGAASGTNTVYNVGTTVCKSTKATSAQVKCSLPSSMINFKSVQDISLTAISGFDTYNTKIYLNVDKDYTVPASALPKANEKTIHIEGQVYFLLSGNTIVEQDLDSPTISSNSKIEAIIPPSSCFNLNMKEIITTVTIPFLADGKLRDENTGNVIKEVSLLGEVSINILDLDNSEIVPCM